MSTTAHAAAGEALELRIVSGLHRGASLPMDSELISIGADETNDIVLLDPGIAPHHAQLLRHAEQQAWQMHDYQGTTSIIAPDTLITLGPVHMMLTAEGAAWDSTLPAPVATNQAPDTGSAGKWPLIIGIALAAGLLAGTLVWSLISSLDTKPSIPGSGQATQPVPVISQPASAPVVVYPPPPKHIPNLPAPPFGLKSISMAFVETNSGQRLLPGDHYQGYQLLAISSHQILFNSPDGQVVGLAW